MSVILAAINATVTAPAPAATTSAAAKKVAFDHLNLILNVDVFILCITGLFILLSLPRAVVRFIHPEEWSNGHWLRYVYVHTAMRSSSAPIAPLAPAHLPLTSKTQMQTADNLLDARSEKSFNMSDDDHDPHGANLYRNASSSSAHALLSRNASSSSGHGLLSRNVSTASGRVRRRRETLPAHMPAWSSMIPWVANVLRIPIRPGLTVGKVAMQLTYFFILLYATLYKSNVFTTPVRAGYVAASQIPVVLILGTKNNLLGVAVGMGYERVRMILPFFSKSEH